jgi:hypothetical protein
MLGPEAKREAELLNGNSRTSALYPHIQGVSDVQVLECMNVFCMLYVKERNYCRAQFELCWCSVL